MNTVSSSQRTALVCMAAMLLVFESPAAPAAESNYEQNRREGEARCRSDRNTAIYTDCGCVGAEVAKELEVRGLPNASPRDALAWPRCPQKDARVIEEAQFKACDSYQSKFRADHETYCRCVAVDVAREYTAHPNFNVKYQEMLVHNALLTCQGSAAAPAIKPEREGAEWTVAGLEKQRADQEASCKLSNMTATYVDCTCASRRMVELATAPGETRPVTSFTDKAFEICPQQDHSVIGQSIFESCESFMAGQRPDHDSFCHCTADEFVKGFYAQTPQLNLRWREKLRRDAMLACGLGSPSKAR